MDDTPNHVFCQLLRPVDPRELLLVVQSALECGGSRDQTAQTRTLRDLFRAGAALVSGGSQQEVFRRTLEGIQGLGFSRVRLYLISDDGLKLRGIQHLGMDHRFEGVELNVGEDDWLHVLIKEPWPHVFRSSPEHPDRFANILDKNDVNEWAEVPLVLTGKVVGVISADNKGTSRLIDEKELDPLGLFGQQAAAAIEQARLLEEARRHASEISERAESDKLKLRRLEGVARAASEIMADLESLSLKERLDLIVRRAAEILDAENSDIFLVRGEDHLTREAEYGAPSQGADDGTYFIGRKYGSMGSVAARRQPFRSSGRDLAHLSLRDSDPMSGCRSLLVVPLSRKSSHEEKLLGMVRVANKRAPGEPGQAAVFTEEDQWLLSLFAESIVAAISSASALDHTRRLLEFSHDGIIAVDERGLVTEFNRQAEKIQGFSADEVLGTPVEALYPPREARRIGGLLRLEGKISDLETAALTKSGRKVPIRLSAAALYDANRDRRGSVGYFEDLRPIFESEERRKRLAKAITAVARAEDEALGAAFGLLAESLISDPTHSFCQILLAAETEGALDIVAGFPLPDTKDGLEWEAWVGKTTPVEKWHDLDAILKRGTPGTWRSGNSNDADSLRKISRVFRLKVPVLSVLLVPLKRGSTTVGLITLGEVQGIQETAFTPNNIELIETLAAQVSVLIARMRSEHTAERRRQELEDLDSATRAMSEAPGFAEVKQEILTHAQRIGRADFVSLLVFDTSKGRFLQKDYTAIGYPDIVVGQFRETEPRRVGVTHKVLMEDYLEVGDLSDPRHNYLNSDTRDPLVDLGVASFQAVALRVGEERVGVLYFNHKQKPPFPKSEACIRNFADAAALALKKARLVDQLARARTSSRAIAKLMTVGDLDKTQKAVAKATAEVLGCDVVCLYACHPGTLEVRQAPYVVGSQRAGIPRSLDPQSLVHQLLKRRGPYVAEEVADDELFRDRSFAKDEKIHSCVATPLRVADQTVGILFVNYRRAHRFTEEERNIIQYFADQAAVAICNAQLFEMQERQNRTLKALSHQLLTTFSKEEVLDRAPAVVEEHLGEGICEIALPDGTGHVIISAARGWSVSQRLVLPPGKGSFSGWVMAEAEPKVIEDLDLPQPFLVHPFLRTEKVRSGVGVPMFGESGTVVGAMLVFSRQPRHFSKVDQDLLGLIANQTAIALERAAKHEAMEAIYQAGLSITRTLGPGRRLLFDEVLRNAVKCIKKPVRGIIHLYDEKTDDLVRESIFPADALSSRGIGTKWSLEASRREGKRIGIVGRAFMNDENQLVHDVAKDPDYISISPDTQSQVSVLLKDGKKKVGVLSLEGPKLGDFDKEDVKTLNALAAHVVLAMQRAAEFEQAEQFRKAALAVASAVASGNLHKTLEAVAHGIRNVADCDAVTIYACQPENGEVDAPPGVVGVRDPSKVVFSGGRNSLLYEAMQCNRPTPAAVTHGPFAQSRFVREEGIVSCLIVPLWASVGKVGVMFVNYRRPHTFGPEEISNFEVFSKQAAVAIHNARIHEELRHSKIMVGRQTALAWMGMVGSAWRHSIELDALTIRDQAVWLGDTDWRSEGSKSEIREGLGSIVRSVERILEKRLAAPLTKDEGVTDLDVCRFVKGWVARLCWQAPYCSVLSGPPGDDPLYVRTNQQWFQHALQILVDNAVLATKDSEEPRVCIRTQQAAGNAVISVADNGSGIPASIERKLFQEVIRKEKGSCGSGVGLLLAKTILETYNGNLEIQSTGPRGTTMLIKIPVARVTQPYPV